MPAPRVVVADDHDETRARIACLLASEFDVVATVADWQAAVEALARFVRAGFEAICHQHSHVFGEGRT